MRLKALLLRFTHGCPCEHSVTVISSPQFCSSGFITLPFLNIKPTLKLQPDALSHAYVAHLLPMAVPPPHDIMMRS